MLQLLRSIAVAALFTAASPALAEAQDEAPPPSPRWEAGVYAGVRFFGEDNGLGRLNGQPQGLSPKTGPALGLRLAYNLSSRFALEGEFQFTPTKTVDGATSMNVLAYRLHAVYHFPQVGHFRFFGLAGLGAITSMVSDEKVVPSDTDAMLHLGLGTKYAFSERWGLRLDLRGEGPLDIGDESRYGAPDFEILVGPYFTFGATEARQVVAQVLDSDGDGLLDPQDKCPQEAEDKDGFEDADGCPDLDNDADGVPDAKDKCPSQPETKNGFQDADGCPDELPPALKKFSGVIEGITFASGKATILKPSFAILDSAAKVLKEFPEIELEVSGHTDNKGKPAYNKDLSQKRADAVKAYLVGKGIAPARLTAVGYGMEKPAGENDTAAGRAKNRRTEFKLLSKSE
jgi:outer membrane protein OmpA-like peptidoglycan-associated protein